MVETAVTNDLTRFGFRELDEAADLLKIYANNGCTFLEDGVTVWLNKYSGKVFLSDEDYNVAVVEGGKLVQFLSCPNCGYEGTQAEAQDELKDFEKYEGFCSEECLATNS